MTEYSKLKFVFKVIVIGDGGVGKTCLTLTFVKKEFKSDYIPTLGVDVYMKEFGLGESKVTLIIWDIAGQEKFDIIRKQYYKGAQGALLVFDLTRPETFYNIEKWHEELVINVSEKIPIILLANKSDVEDKRQVKSDEIELMAKKLRCDYFETSAKTGKNVDKAFYSLLKKIIKLNLLRRV
ncbi:MAG: GTP-binding protein [Candidatus Odinarchaeia archaeon]